MELYFWERMSIRIESVLDATDEGDDVLTPIRDGVLDSFSIGFRPVRDQRRGG